MLESFSFRIYQFSLLIKEIHRSALEIIRPFIIFLLAEYFELDSPIAAIAAAAEFVGFERISVEVTTPIVSFARCDVVAAVVPIATISELVTALLFLILTFVVAPLFAICVKANVFFPLWLRLFAAAARATIFIRYEFILIISATGRRIIVIPRHTRVTIFVLHFFCPISVPA